MDKITRAGEKPAFSLVPPGTAGYEPPPGLTRDPERARQLLAEAGFPGGKGFPIVYYLFKGDSDLDRDIAVELQGMFARELGVTIQLQQQEWKVYLASLSALDFDICRSTWVGDYADPNTFMDMFVTDGGNNRTGWSSPIYDQAIADAAREIDPQKRFAIFRAGREAPHLRRRADLPALLLRRHPVLRRRQARRHRAQLARRASAQGNVLEEAVMDRLGFALYRLHRIRRRRAAAEGGFLPRRGARLARLLRRVAVSAAGAAQSHHRARP